MTFTATVTNTGTGVTPNGQVTFLLNGTTSIGTYNLVGGVATLNISTMPIGSDTITADYIGNGTTRFATSNSAALPQTVNSDATSTALALTSGNPLQPNQPFTFMATVTNTGTGVTPNGQVTFLLTTASGTVNLGTYNVVNGVATITLPSLPVGTDTITADYIGNGTSRFAISSNSLTLTIGS